MSKTKVILNAEDFQYPTKAERIEAHGCYPMLTNFGFERESHIELIFEREKSLYQAKKEEDLYF